MAERRRDPNKAKDAYQVMQARFVEAWHSLPSTLSKTERGRRAAIEAGYSPATATSAAAKLLSKPKILEAILGAHPRARAERAGLDATWLLSELADLWDTPLTSLFDDDGRLLDIDQMPFGAQKLIAGFEITEETEVCEGRRRVTTRVGKIKLIDRLAVLDKIGRNYLVSAYTSPEQRDAEKSLAQLLRAITKQVPGATVEHDITPKKKLPEQPRRLSDVLGSSDE